MALSHELYGTIICNRDPVCLSKIICIQHTVAIRVHAIKEI